MLMALRRAGFHTAVVYNHLGCLHMPQYRPRSCQVIYIQILRLWCEQRRVQYQHRSIDAVLVQYQFM